MLPLPLCHGRDALCYAHSTAIYLRQCGAGRCPPAVAQWLQARGPALQEVMEQTMHRMRFARHLPQSRKLGRDVQQVRAAYDLLRPDTAPRAAHLWAPAVRKKHREQKAKGKGQTQYARQSELPSRLWLTGGVGASPMVQPAASHPFFTVTCQTPLLRQP